MIQAIYDADIVNRFANDPSIRPFIGGSGELNLGEAVREPNVFLFGEHGGFCLSWTGPQTYEVHTMIVPEGRGRWAIAAARESLRHMQLIGATHLWTRVHPEAAHTALFTRMMGFREAGTNVLDAGDGPVTWRVFDWRSPCQQQS